MFYIKLLLSAYCVCIFGIIYLFQPLIGGFFTGNFHCQMGKPATGRCAVPMFHAGRNIHHISGKQLLRPFPPFLIESSAADTD